MNRPGTGFTRKTDYYDLFGIPRDASSTSVDEAFRNYLENVQQHSWIPWRDAAVREGAEAYYHLSDETRRKRYDESLDYELILPDPEGVPAEFEKYFEVQKIATPREYERLYKQFLMLKHEREDKLWSLRATMYFFLACFFVLLFSSFAFFVFQKNDWLSESVDLFYRRWGLFASSAIMGGGYLFFRVLYLDKEISRREKQREIELNEKSSQT
ncbi:molecular chaperone DnaJ [Leptospira wolffii]|uniref:molecular chaperone DnaJ n=1 Tax=Leptospira wolffii TaxID=409998 RepID=UPI0010844A88|nr:molecular chaperone DnaJ [Leptospira wolffii]TGK64714.1 molecular chaperone DnaJ [Leptospira wolffii]TGK76887.1 molecular chaperone DnaJ [Leptospira wolffii]TGK77261.1 molecular chaperone DnaJ [Leptospira wolffii]TGL26656.1 molecular chaperone DnaJ [Leptospira wolffii]